MGMTNNEMTIDIQAPSAPYLKTKESGSSSADELLVKIRKPYTISKQREKWTEKEHEKFLEALKLYGRSWRQIQAHIGTKTAVQIRSHAQKFFSKVGRESGKVNTIEIPPPRPKRKPLHPYPRKVAHSATMDARKVEQSTLSIPSVRQDSRSPTSVLSAVVSDSTVLHISNPLSSVTPVASPVGSGQSESSSCEQENGYCSRTETDVEEDQSPLLLELAPNVSSTQNNETLMVLDTSSKRLPSPERNSPKAKRSTCLKLFGKNVTVTESQKSSSFSHLNVSQMLPNAFVLSQYERTNMDLENESEYFKQPTSHGDFSGLPSICTWSVWNGGAASMYYRLPSENTNALLPMWWTLPGHISLSSADVNRKPDIDAICNNMPCVSTVSPERAEENISSTQGLGLPIESAPAFTLKPSQNSAFSTVKLSNNKSFRSFLPYKRCTNEQQADQSSNLDSDRENLAVELCL